MKFVSSFFVANGTILKKVGENQDPLTFEEVGQENGFMLYETGIDKLFTDPAKLEIAEIHDRAYIFVNKEPRCEIFVFFSSSSSSKMREKCISFAQFVYFWVKCVYFSIFEW